MSRDVRAGDDGGFRAVADATYDWESWIAVDGRLVWVNPAVERLTGYSVEDCLRMADYPLPIVHPDDREHVATLWRGALAGSSGNDVEFRVRRKDGSERWAAISWQPMYGRDGLGLGFRTSVRDIDERKGFERRLHEAHERAELAGRAKSDFLAHLSHELRHPLQCVAGFAELLQGSNLDERQARWVEILAQQSDLLLRQMEDLLAFAALDAHDPKLESKPFDLVETVRAATLAMSPRAATRGLSLSFDATPDAPRHVRGDVARITQILGNLLQNAVKFTVVGGVRVTLSRARDGAALIEVRDTGVGIATSELRAILEPFTQGGAAAAVREGGVGLGLSIVHRLVRAMGGTLGVSSREGSGTTVTVSLPLPPAAEIEEATTGREVADSLVDEAFGEAHPLEILVVDDSAPARELVLEMLRVLGYEPEEADGGERAIARVARGGLDLVFVDLQMPGVDGLAVAERIGALSLEHAPTLVLLTANVFIGTERPPGIDLVVTKPVRLVELREVLRHVASGEMPSLPRAGLSNGTSPLDAEVLEDLRTTETGDGRTMLERIVPRVCAEATRLHTELARGVASSEYASIVALAHRFRGNALLVGARDAAARAAELERAAEQALESVDGGAAVDRRVVDEAMRVRLERIAATWTAAEKALVDVSKGA